MYRFEKNTLNQGSETFWIERAKQQCSIMEEGYVIKYVDKFSGDLKQDKKSNIILFQQCPLFLLQE